LPRDRQRVTSRWQRHERAGSFSSARLGRWASAPTTLRLALRRLATRQQAGGASSARLRRATRPARPWRLRRRPARSETSALALRAWLVASGRAAGAFARPSRRRIDRRSARRRHHERLSARVWSANCGGADARRPS